VYRNNASDLNNFYKQASINTSGQETMSLRALLYTALLLTQLMNKTVVRLRKTRAVRWLSACLPLLVISCTLHVCVSDLHSHYIRLEYARRVPCPIHIESMLWCTWSYVCML